MQCLTTSTSVTLGDYDDGSQANLHKTGGVRNPNRCGTVFFVNPQNLEADYLGFWDC